MAPRRTRKQDDSIIIDLAAEALAGTKPRDQEDLLQRDAYKAVRGRLKQNLPTSDSANRSSGGSARPPIVTIEDERRHDVITVNARRGDGKTTFVLSLLRDIEQGGMRGLYSLGIIDPTKVETKQNFTVLVVNRVWKVVRSHRKIAVPFDGQKSYKDVEKALHEVAKGLNQLPGIGGETFHDDQWKDPDYILDEGLDAAEAGDGFERHIDYFFKTAAEFLGIQAFVLAVDDIDTAFDRGWPVLEAIRKYLTSPYLKLILSGDLELYQLLVRRQQWAHMSKDFVDHERWAFKEFGGQKKYSSTLYEIYNKVDELQDQYLIKIFQPENRFPLKNLEELINSGATINFSTEEISPVSPRSRPISAPKPIPIRIFTRRYARRLLAYNSRKDQDAVMRVILVQPVRTALRILAGGRHMGARRPLPQTQNIKAVNNFQSAAYTTLLQTGLDPDFAGSDDPRRVFLSLIDWITRLDDWHNTPRLYPDHLHQSMNLSSIYASAATTNVFRQRPDAMMTYWVKIAAVRELIDTNRVSGESLQSFLQHINLYNIEDSDRTAGRIAGWLRHGEGRGSLNNDKSIYALPVLAGKLNNPQTMFTELYGIGYQNKNQSTKTIKSMYTYPAFASAKIMGLKNESFKFFSPSEGQAYQALPMPLRKFHENLTEREVSYTTASYRQIRQKYVLYNSINSLSDTIKESAAADTLKLPYLTNTSGTGAHFGTYSFLNLISVIEKLFYLLDTEEIEDWPEEEDRPNKDNDADEDEDSNKEENFLSLVRDTLRETTRTTAYPSRKSQNSDAVEDEQESDDAPDPDDEGEPDGGAAEDVNERLVRALGYWLRAGYECGALVEAPVTLARIWTRFHQAGDTISESLTHLESRYLGVAMHRYSVGFLHAVAVELGHQDSNFSIKSRMTNTPTTTNEPFVDVIKEMCRLSLAEENEPYDGSPVAIPDSDWFQFFRFLFACPLWGFFLIQENDWEGSGRDFRKQHEWIFRSYQSNLCDFINQKLEDNLFESGEPMSEVAGKSKFFLGDLFRVNYHVDGQDIKFPNLHPLLNTVPIQGQHIGPPPSNRFDSPLSQNHWTKNPGSNKS